MRTPESERQAEAVAYGLFVLNAPIGWDHPTRWRDLREEDRDLWIAKGRFVRTYADDHLQP